MKIAAGATKIRDANCRFAFCGVKIKKRPPNTPKQKTKQTQITMMGDETPSPEDFASKLLLHLKAKAGESDVESA